MKTITASKARANLYRLIEETADSSEPVQITGKQVNAILVSEEDWRAMQETMYLLSIPGMRESIREGRETPIEECAEESMGRPSGLSMRFLRFIMKERTSKWT